MKLAETKEDVHAIDLPLPTFIPRRYRPGNLGTWSGHLPFANDLILAMRPSLIVELGTHYGESYFGFCQTVAENGIDCLCYAVDHWQGEEHAGFYGEEVFEDVQRHNDTYYKSFSYLLRGNFDDVVDRFANETIGLLHIDGLHTYEAVSRDFRNWLPKVRPGGIVLLHDIAVRHVDFGVWQLWDELSVQFSRTFAFHHSWGLGVVRKPQHGDASPALLDLLFDSPPVTQERIRRHYVIYASHLENVFFSKEETRTKQETEPKHASALDAGTAVHVLVFRYGPDGYSEDSNLERAIEFGQWTVLTFDLTKGVGDGHLRIDLAHCPCVIEIGGIAVVKGDSGSVLWSGEDVRGLRALTYSGSVMLLPCEDKCLLFSYGNNPQLQLPSFSESDNALHVSISLRVDRTFEAVSELLNSVVRVHAESLQVCKANESKIVELRLDIHNAETERKRVEDEFNKVTVEKNDARRNVKMLEQLVESTRLRVERESAQRIDVQRRLETELTILRNSLEPELINLRNSLASERCASRYSDPGHGD